MDGRATGDCGRRIFHILPAVNSLWEKYITRQDYFEMDKVKKYVILLVKYKPISAGYIDIMDWVLLKRNTLYH